VLEILSKEIGSSRASFATATDEYILKRTEELVMECLEKFVSTKDEITEREKFAITRLKNSIFICFKTVQSQFADSQFEPLGYEIEFSDKSPLGCIDIKTDDGHKVKLTGKIDRADIYEADGKAYVRVVDYKTGSKEFKLDDVLYGLSLQLMVYLNKLVSSNDKYTYGGALYFHVTNPVVKSESRTDNEGIDELISKELMLKGIVPYDEKLLNAYDDKFAASLIKGTAKKKRVDMHGFEVIDKYLNKKIGSICSDILKGDISISPTKKNKYVPCTYCPYGSICRFDPGEEGNSYNVYSSKNEYEEIIKEMEEAIDVDTRPTERD
jgi:ATP-dependent helicase/nuclease subunit B